MAMPHVSFLTVLLLIIAAALPSQKAVAVGNNEITFRGDHDGADFEHPSPSFSFPILPDPSQQDHVMHSHTAWSHPGGSPAMLHFDASPPFAGSVAIPATAQAAAGDVPSSSQSRKRQRRPRLPPPAQAQQVTAPEEHVVVPALPAEEIRQEEEWHLERVLKTMLDRIRIYPHELKMKMPRDDVQHIHLGLLQQQLQRQLNVKRVIPLGPTIGHNGRVFATPIPPLRDLILQPLPGQEKNVALAIFSIRYPGPAMTWQRYALVPVQNQDVFNALLEGHKRVGTLKDFLTRY